MGKSTSTESARRLADMSTPVDLPEYSPPPPDECVQEEYPVTLSSDDQLIIRMSTYENRIVDFALIHMFSYRGEWFEVARFDCCHSSVHRHQLGRSGTRNDRTNFLEIPGASGPESWDVIANGYDLASDDMFDHWEEQTRQWEKS